MPSRIGPAIRRVPQGHTSRLGVPLFGVRDVREQQMEPSLVDAGRQRRFGLMPRLPHQSGVERRPSEQQTAFRVFGIGPRELLRRLGTRQHIRDRRQGERREVRVRRHRPRMPHGRLRH